MNQVVKGKDLMVFVGSGSSIASIACATNHTLNLSTETTDVSHKDNVGSFKETEIKSRSWSITTDNLMAKDQAGKGVYDMYTYYASGEKLHVIFALKSSASLDNTKGWTPEINTVGDKYWEGDVVVTALDINAPDGDNVSYNATLTGTGALELKTKTA